MNKIILSIILAVAAMKGVAQEPVNDAFKQIRYADKAFNYTNQVTMHTFAKVCKPIKQ